MKPLLKTTLVLSTLAFTYSCTTTPPPPPRYREPTAAPLVRYQSVTLPKKHSVSITGVRHLGLRDTALSLGARGGLAWRAVQINRIIRRHERKLDLIYNFNALLLDDNVLPPVLIEGRHTLEQSSDDIIRIADRAYVIHAQARFVTMAPTWREYLLLNFTEPEMPDYSMLPKNDVERGVWDRYVNQGWQAGITQADVIFAENLGRLKRDYEGMIRYRSLLAQNMVSRPFVAKMFLGVTGGDSQMAVNDRILRITTLPQFNTASNQWEAQVTADDRQLAVEDES